ncbi:MAG: PAS domain-containing sensor histidine kinase [Lentisphaeria bacterium]|nr:PAS domain-containing sensor histidine kinase [Candidatus Neomarinimicrobiota bacterium]MCF7841938.1 PAS domain-containing sensor histidine kinase [Lentisphaeria bacterium]
MKTEKTWFAPAGRLPTREITRQAVALAEESLLKQLLDSIPNVVMVLNRFRQVVYANDSLWKTLDGEIPENVFGFRPGEIFDCIHSDDMSDGCGTSEFCRECGAAKAILNSQKMKGVDLQECRITRKHTDEALDWMVKASHFSYRDEDYTIFALTDISGQKRREVLERIFFHDVMNTAGTLHGFTKLINQMDTAEIPEAVEQIGILSERLISEIRTQQLLTRAEQGELALEISPINAGEIMEEIAREYRQHPVSKDRQIVVNPIDESLTLRSDRTLLRRVIGNMLKNAIEASEPGETITLTCSMAEQAVEFRVHNPQFITRRTQLQIFNRSFSTKGKGRGLGTYSMKLLTERYLNGTVGFESKEADGTTFFVRIPKRISARKD